MVDRFQLLVDAVGEYAIFMLDLDGTVESWNFGAQRIKGYTADEIIGRSFATFYCAADVATGKPSHDLTAAARAGQHCDEGWRVRKDHTTFWANIVITAITDEDGQVTGFAKVTRDDSDRRAAELSSRHVDVMTERERISCDLQDTVVHHIFRAGLRLSAACTMTADPKLTMRLAEVIEDLDNTLREIREMITGLHQPSAAAGPRIRHAELRASTESRTVRFP